PSQDAIGAIGTVCQGLRSFSTNLSVGQQPCSLFMLLDLNGKEGSENENHDYYRPKFAWTGIRRVRLECIPALYSNAAAARSGRRLHESALRQPLLLRRGHPANRRRSALFARGCTTGLDAAWSNNCEHFTVPHFSGALRVADRSGGQRPCA